MSFKRLMNKQKKKYRFFILIVLWVAIVSCKYYIGYRAETEINREIGYYTFDPSTILDSLNRGDTDVFIFQEAWPETDTSGSSGTVFWSQEDYFRVAQVLHQQLWQVSLNTYNYYTVFSVDCSDVENGAFSEAEFFSNQVIQSVEGEDRIEYHITINPTGDWVNALKKELSPNLHFVEPINLDDYRITAEEALQIAEENGGFDKRLEYDNTCYIDVYAPGSNFNGWHVSYYNKNSVQRIFKVVIDPQTGGIQKVRD